MIANNTCYGNVGDGIGKGGKSCNIGNYNCVNNNRRGIFNFYQSTTCGASGTLVGVNSLYDTRVSGARTQAAEYSEQADGLTGIMF